MLTVNFDTGSAAENKSTPGDDTEKTAAVHTHM